MFLSCLALSPPFLPLILLHFIPCHVISFEFSSLAFLSSSSFLLSFPSFFSYGMLLYELLSRHSPWENASPAEIVGQVAQGRRPPWPTDPEIARAVPSSFKQLGLLLWWWCRRRRRRNDVASPAEIVGQVTQGRRLKWPTDPEIMRAIPQSFRHLGL